MFVWEAFDMVRKTVKARKKPVRQAPPAGPPTGPDEWLIGGVCHEALR
jgi:hypothetical protein